MAMLEDHDDDDITDLTDDFTANGKHTQKAGILRRVLSMMNPSVCLTGEACNCTLPTVDDDDEIVDYDTTIIPIIKDLKNEGKARTFALQKLFQLTDKESQHHRVPIVCSQSFDIISALIPCILPDANGTDRRQALLLLNNLCIPKENKERILMGEVRDVFLNALLLIFHQRLPEAHIAAACVYNLSFLESAKVMLISYTPPEDFSRVHSARSSYSFTSPTAKDTSLLRIVEDTVVYFSPYMAKAYQKKVATVEAATIRWSMALIRNLVTVPENALIVAKTTQFPQLAARCLLESTKNGVNIGQWTVDSIEDSSLLLILMLIQNDEDSCRTLDTKEIRDAMERVSKLPGIHGVRAGVILQKLDETSSQFGSSETEMVTTHSQIQLNISPNPSASINGMASF